jgi:uncharacterized protein YjiS (DUF1127 family)
MQGGKREGAHRRPIETPEDHERGHTMSTIADTRRQAHAHTDANADDAAPRAAIGLFQRLRKSIAHERVCSQLRALDDRMLADIGLSRSMIPPKAWWFPGP